MEDKFFFEWKKSILEELDPEIQKLIEQSNFDLYNGPVQDDSYPGFTTACKRIHQSLENVISSQLYFSRDGDFWIDKEPDWNEEFASDWLLVERDQLIIVVVGKELAGYIK